MGIEKERSIEEGEENRLTTATKIMIIAGCGMKKPGEQAKHFCLTMRWSSEKELLLNRIKIYRRVDNGACGAGNLNLNGFECALDDELEGKSKDLCNFSLQIANSPVDCILFLRDVPRDDRWPSLRMGNDVKCKKCDAFLMFL